MKRTKSGFTIVELLIVIAVIAILAAIVIVSYTGIRQRAIVSSLQLDLSNVATQLKLYQVTNDSYPTSNDCSSGPNPAPPKICLKTSNGNSYVNYVIDNGNPQTFCVAEDNSGVDYRVTDGIGPVAGRCNTVTTSPSGLAAAGGIGQVVLNWSAPSDNGGSAITGYKIYQGTSSGSETLLATLGNVLTYTNTGLSTGTTYYYKVTAINTIGESGYSNEASDATNPITYTLTTIAGTGGSVSSGGTYNTGSTPTITASPNALYSFSSWSGSTGCSGIASHTITMDTNKSCTANFVLNSIAAPSAPSVSASTPSSVTTWSWGAVSCPGNSVRYQYDYTTNYGYDSGWVATGGTSVAFTTSSEGYTYTVAVQAQCYNGGTSSSWSGSGSAGYYRPVSVILYYYNKYNVATVYVEPSTSYLDTTSNWGAFNGNTSKAIWGTLGTGYGFNTSTGRYYQTGSINPSSTPSNISAYIYDSINNNIQANTLLSCYDTGNGTLHFSPSGSGIIKKGIDVAAPTSSQGSLVQSNITAANGTYPDNGKYSDGYWYVKGARAN